MNLEGSECGVWLPLSGAIPLGCAVTPLPGSPGTWGTWRAVCRVPRGYGARSRDQSPELFTSLKVFTLPTAEQGEGLPPHS